MHDTVSHAGTDMSSSLLLPENGQLEEVLAVNIPSDQMRMIQNINALISEVTFILMSVNCFLVDHYNFESFLLILSFCYKISFLWKLK